MNNFQCDEYFFSSNFDSGNLRKVELVRSCPDTEILDNIIHTEFDVWTSPDCYGTPHENPNRTWFFFSIQGGRPFRNVKLNVRNLNRQAKLFSQGMQPVMRIGENGRWERIKDKPTYSTESDSFYISFVHRTTDMPNTPHFYAFTYPFTYTECQSLFDKYDKKYRKCLEDVEFIANRIASLEKAEITPINNNNKNKKTDSLKLINSNRSIAKESNIIESNMSDIVIASPLCSEVGDCSSTALCDTLYEKMSKKELQNEIYYHRELLVHSLERRRVELITISSYHGIRNEFEERLSNLFPDIDTQRCRTFKDKKIIFMSSRVHPGETAASFVLNGFLSLILDRKSSIGSTLRQMYVFKIVPFLNPDGVFNGLYRTDTLGQNLNRMYISPKIDVQPSIYAVKKLIKFYHLGYDRFDEDNKKLILIEPSKIDNKIVTPPPAKKIVVKKDDICSTASLFDFVEQYRNEHKMENDAEVSSQSCGSKETTSSEGEENVSQSNIQSHLSSQLQCKVFTEKLIPEIKTIAQEPLPKKSPTSFIKKPSDHIGRKTAAFKTVFGASHTGNVRNAENKLKEHENITIARPKTKKTLPRKDIKSGNNSSNLSLKLMNKKNNLCCQNINISSEHWPKSEDGMEKGCNEEKSNLFLYMDFHGHASKKGVFMYGNHFQSTPEAVECLLLPRLMGVNCHHFHYDACNFSERNMYRKEKRDGLSKEGSGRVAVFKMTGLIKCYTLESNYNTGKYVNTLPNRSKEVNSKLPNIVPPKYTPAIYEEVGRALGPSILDITNSNTLSRIFNSEFRSIQGLRIALRNEIERHGSQRPANTTKVLSSQQNVKRVKRNSLSASSAQPSNDVSKENKALYHMPWDLAVPSSSSSSSSPPSTSIQSNVILHSLNQPKIAHSKPTTRCIKKNPLKARSTNLYGKKDASVTKKKPKPAALLESCSSNKKDHTFQIPPKKVRVSPTPRGSNQSKESSSLLPQSRKPLDSPGSSELSYKTIIGDNLIPFVESSNLSENPVPIVNVDLKNSEEPIFLLSKTEMNSLSNSPSLTQFYSTSDLSILKKCTSDSGLDCYGTKSENSLSILSTPGTSVSSFKSTGTIDDAVASCSSRILGHGSSAKQLLGFRKSKKSGSYLLKSGGNIASLNAKMKNSFGGSENSKLLRKKRTVRHDSLILKRKKNKVKIARH